ncbi:winged helix-turn-helix transcriptional regulator [Streptomyces mirabilis]|uniref:winged helix-turn-helix transcriptional regulator n=1 Tax=Streptomyces mirabilis TaxID=68239 RepID=UPI0033182F41
MPSRISLEERGSPLCAAAQRVCEWWALLILQDAFDGYSRFDQFQENLGVSSSMLTTRLKVLVSDGLLERRPYQTNPVRREYVLTDLRRSLRPVARPPSSVEVIAVQTQHRSGSPRHPHGSEQTAHATSYVRCAASARPHRRDTRP